MFYLTDLEGFIQSTHIPFAQIKPHLTRNCNPACPVSDSAELTIFQRISTSITNSSHILILHHLLVGLLLGCSSSRVKNELLGLVLNGTGKGLLPPLVETLHPASAPD